MGVKLGLDGVNGTAVRFRWVKPPTSAELTQLAQRIVQRVGRFLERQGLLRSGMSTTHVIFDPLDFTALAHPCARGISASIHVIARLAALVPKPRVNLTRFHGVVAAHRALHHP